MASKVGPIKASLDGRLTVSDAVAPERCRLTAAGLDPVAGGGEGSADVTLEEDGDETVVSYAGTIEPQGKIAQLGSRLVLGVARTQIEAFFMRFSEAAAAGRLPGANEAPAPAAETPPIALDHPAQAPVEAEDAPPLAPGAETAVRAETPIAPTAVPDVPDPAAIAAAEQADPKAGGTVTRIMLVAAIVAAIGVAVYWFALQTPPPA